MGDACPYYGLDLWACMEELHRDTLELISGLEKQIPKAEEEECPN